MMLGALALLGLGSSARYRDGIGVWCSAIRRRRRGGTALGVTGLALAGGAAVQALRGPRVWVLLSGVARLGCIGAAGAAVAYGARRCHAAAERVKSFFTSARLILRSAVPARRAPPAEWRAISRGLWSSHRRLAPRSRRSGEPHPQRG